MRCTDEGCPGAYESREITHTVRHRGEIVVIDHVPAEVCSVCGDTLLGPDIIRHLEVLLEARAEPTATVALYQYA